jgi:hypothetical protein
MLSTMGITSPEAQRNSQIRCYETLVGQFTKDCSIIHKTSKPGWTSLFNQHDPPTAQYFFVSQFNPGTLTLHDSSTVRPQVRPGSDELPPRSRRKGNRLRPSSIATALGTLEATSLYQIHLTSCGKMFQTTTRWISSNQFLRKCYSSNYVSRSYTNSDKSEFQI